MHILPAAQVSIYAIGGVSGANFNPAAISGLS